MSQRFRDEHSIVIESDGVNDLFVVTPERKLAFSHLNMDEDIGMDLSGAGFYGENILSDLLISLQQQPVVQFSRFGRIPQIQEATILAGVPVYSRDGTDTLVAYLVRPLPLHQLRTVFEVFIGLGETGEVVLGQLRGEGLESGVNMISNFRNGLGRVPDEACQMLRRSQHGLFPMLLSLMQQNGEGWMVDNSCVDVYAIWKWFPELEWGMVIKQDREEIMQPINQLQQYLLVSLPFIFFGLLLIARYLAVSISRPIRQLTDELKQGDVDREAHVKIREIEQLANALVEFEGNVEKANRAKDEFMASMSHELRTPLTSIIGNAEYLSEKLVIPELKQVVQSIETAGYAQLALVNDVLDMSKIESGKFTLDDAPFNLEKLLDDVKAMLDIRARDAGLQLIVDQQNRESYELMGDSNRIVQILVNLLSNAIKFTEQGEVCLTTCAKEGWLQFEVKDRGIGMSEEEQSRLFQKFEQADGSISRRFGGSGLGLYISLNLAQMMEGKITVNSVKGEGSTFTLLLPYRKSGVLIERRKMVNGASVHQHERFEGEVLVVEDTPELQLLERRMLEAMGVTVTVASNGQEAVDAASAQDFDLILMDMQMPVMDGIEATQTLRARGDTTPIYALTANVMVKHREQFKQAGCDGFIAKPIDKSMLQDTLRTVLVDDEQRKLLDTLKLEHIEWSSASSVGHPDMDHQHQLIVHGINALVSYCMGERQSDAQGEVLTQLSNLHDLVLDHVQQEEELLLQSGYPQLEGHLESHRLYWNNLAELYKNRFDDHQIEAITLQMMSWWKQHILVEDMAYKEHVQGWLQSKGRQVEHDNAAMDLVDEELMAVFVETSKQRQPKLSAALEAEAWQEVRELAHAIKGSAASFGYPELSTQAEKVQFLIDEQQLDEIAQHGRQLLAQLEEVLS